MEKIHGRKKSIRSTRLVFNGLSRPTVGLCGLFLVLSVAGFSQTAKLTFSGANVRMVSSGGNVQIVMNHSDWVNDASASAFAPGTGTVKFTGTSGNALIGGTASTAFYNLVSDKSGMELQLESDISVSNQANLLAGNVNLQNQTLDLLGTGNLVGEVYPNGQRFYCVDNNLGRIKATRPLASGANTNIAGLALDLDVSGSAPGSTVFYRGHDAQTSTAGGGSTSIGRYFDVTPTVTGGFTYTFVFHYHEQELGMVPESDFVLYRSPSYAANTGDWEEWGFGNGPQSPGYPTAGLATHNTSANTVTLTGIPSFSRWTTSNALVNPLPIELLVFTTECEEDHILLKWVTATEINNERFTIHRSSDLLTWQEVTTVPGAGNSNALLAYETTDELAPRGLTYYRLTQTDYDGAYETFNPVSVVCHGTGTDNHMTVYPNPASEMYTVSIQTHVDVTDAQILLIDLNGKVQQSYSANLQKGSNNFTFNRLGIASGSYTVFVTSDRIRLAPSKLIIY